MSAIMEEGGRREFCELLTFLPKVEGKKSWKCKSDARDDVMYAVQMETPRINSRNAIGH